MNRFRYFIILILIVPLVGCSFSANPEMALIDPDDESGLGGTGILAQESGMGGTGIIGEITGFGSIFVNGEKVEIDQNTALYLDGQPVVNYLFKRGEIVEILAISQRAVNLAQEIRVRHEIIGPVDSIDSQSNSFTVLGQKVLISGQDQFLPQIGRNVQVSGFRDKQGSIHATLIEETTQHDVLLTGILRKIKDSYYIGRQAIRLTGSTAFNENSEVRVEGIMREGLFTVSKYTLLEKLHFTMPVSRLFVQGFVGKGQGRQYNIGTTVFAVQSLQLSRQFDTQTDQIVRLEMRRNLEGSWEAIRSISLKGLPLGQSRLSDTKSYWKTNRFKLPSRIKPSLPRSNFP